MTSTPPSGLSRGLVPWASSLALHGGLAGLLLLLPPMHTIDKKLLPIEITDRELPRPPEPEPEPPKPKEPEARPEAPKPEPPKPRVTSRVQPKEQREPPPTSTETKEPVDEPQEETGPRTFGIQLEGATRAGSGDGVAVPVGDSLAVSPKVRKRGPPKKEKLPEGDGFKKEYSRGEAAPIAVITTRPKVRKKVLASYPVRARELGIEGRVVLELTIDGDGKVIEARLLKGLHPLLDQEALDAARKMLFAPATVGGTPVKVTIPYTFTFVLD